MMLCFIHYRPPSSGKQSGGFTLVELAIVVLIIGLLLGGIMAGRHLIRQSEITGTYAQAQELASAIKNFVTKYQSLPGDMPNATSFWGTRPWIGEWCFYHSVKSKETCNGNGDGYIDYIGPAGTNATLGNEVTLVWQHMSNAGMIKGTYNGGHHISVPYPIDVLYPLSKIGNGYFNVMSRVVPAGSSVFEGDYTHSFIVGDTATAGGYNGPILSPNEMRAFDSKFDDGKPATGSLRAQTIYAFNPMAYYCTSGDVVTSVYSINDEIRCLPIFYRFF